MLRLVEHDGGKAATLVFPDVTSEQRVARDHDVRGGDFSEKILPSRAMNRKDVESGNKSLRLATPVPDE